MIKIINIFGILIKYFNLPLLFTYLIKLITNNYILVELNFNINKIIKKNKIHNINLYRKIMDIYDLDLEKH